MTPERSTLMAVTNLQADLHAGITPARDMGSHSNGYADVDVRNAINEGDIDGPRFQVAGRGIVWGPSRRRRLRRPTRSAGDRGPIGRRGARRRARARRQRAWTGSSCIPGGALFVQRRRARRST